jgi:hypothetical protein
MAKTVYYDAYNTDAGDITAVRIATVFAMLFVFAKRTTPRPIGVVVSDLSRLFSNTYPCPLPAPLLRS